MLASEQRRALEELAASRMAPVREVERAKVLLGYAAGTTITELQRQLGFKSAGDRSLHRQGDGGGCADGLERQVPPPT